MQYDVVLIGGGIVGLSTAWRILEERPHTRLLVLEKERAVAMHQTGRNSGVIHSGIYYKPGSYKSRLCRTGYHDLLEFCREENVAHEICGKVIVAVSPEELPRLQALEERARANELAGVRYLNLAELREKEPEVSGVKGLWVPQTGIVDYVEMSRKLAQRIKAAGGEIKFHNQVEAIVTAKDAKVVRSGREEYQGSFLINCGGLHCDRLARLDGLRSDVSIIPFRGEYFTLTGPAQKRVRNLIYPVPDPAFPFLGVHFTRMIAGGVECGPNAVLALRREGYRKTDFSLRDAAEVFTNPGFHKLALRHWNMGLMEVFRSLSKTAFVKALQRLIPAIKAEELIPAEAGVRAQAMRRDGSLVDDFHFVEGTRSLHVLNAPSPAATASLAIGSEIRDRYLRLASN